jgi:hypothetical protein
MTEQNNNNQQNRGPRPAQNNNQNRGPRPANQGQNRDSRPPQQNNNNNNNNQNRRPQHNNNNRNNNNPNNNSGGANNNNRPQNNNNRNRPRGNFRGNRGGSNAQRMPQGNRYERLCRRYDLLLEAHNLARSKYFELFHRADYNQGTKLERIFYGTLEQLRAFERDVETMTIEPEFKEQFFNRINPYKAEYTYSENHKISNVGVNTVKNEDITDPHVLQTQINADYAEDKEETVGTWEDYNAYKGIV